ncbi:thioredoxin-like protein [Absidia repens]|uniref:Thioredoxin-like protein n=1 Tax=Absidia repens TaxID=90262 RepID=A0A1X2IPF4_9FUNG|nr:thioredoxin-like protein [Absidia repens]
MAPNKLTLYNAKLCPYAQRAVIALKEVGVAYEEVTVDLLNKPEWYAAKVNPEGKVPALDVDGTILAESLVIIELINDLYPEKKLLPSDPIQKAQIRFFIEYFNKLWTNLFKHITGQLSLEDYIKEAEPVWIRVNELLLEQSQTGPYFLGDQFSLADVALAPFIARIRAVTSRSEAGFEFKAVKENPRLAQFLQGVLDRPSFKESYIGDDGFFTSVQKKFNYRL